MRTKLSEVALHGLRRWAEDDLLFDDNNDTSPEFWAWMFFRLREAEDKPEWFPKGKSATLQRIEDALVQEAREIEA